MVERWMPVRGFEGLYEVSDLGRVRSIDRIVRCARGRGHRTIPGRTLKVKTERRGYQVVALMPLSGGYRYLSVHRLVLEAFVGTSPSDQHECRHGNGAYGDNRLSNLSWGTKGQNMADQYAHGTRIASEWHPGAVLTSELVGWIRESQQKAPVIARVLDVDPKTVYRARAGVTYWALKRTDLSAALR